MGRRYYTEYVAHCLRFYARHENPVFSSESAKADWDACDKALEQFDTRDRVQVLAVFRENDTIADNIYSVAKRYNVDQDKIWKLVTLAEKEVAQYRGLADSTE